MPFNTPICTRMLFAWNDGLAGLNSPRIYALGTHGLGDALAGLPELPPAQPARTAFGRSELLSE